MLDDSFGGVIVVVVELVVVVVVLICSFASLCFLHLNESLAVVVTNYRLRGVNVSAKEVATPSRVYSTWHKSSLFFGWLVP